jgi:FMN-dependent NADH-azoreductase
METDSNSIPKGNSMARLQRIDASLRQEGSFSRSVADTFQATWTAAHPNGTVSVRDLGRDPLPYLTQFDVDASQVPEDQRTAEQRAAAARPAALVDELVAADAILLGIPLYNWGTPASVKTWIDYLLLDPRTRAHGLLAGRPAVLVSARGGSYRPGTPHEGWDYAEPYLRRILAEVFGLDLRVITPELTLAEVNPALAEFKEHAKVSLVEAHDQADAAARDLADRIAA